MATRSDPLAKRGSKRSVIPATAVVAGLAVVVVVWALLRQEDVYHVTVSPGGSVTTILEGRMQRAFEHKSFAKDRGLPVVCQLTRSDGGGERVTARVVDTGHRLHIMWAKIQVHADSDARPGASKWVADFTIDGKSGWPKVTMVVSVRSGQANRDHP